MKRKIKRALAVLLAVFVAVPNVSGLTISSVYAATYRNGAQSGPSTSYKNGKYYKNYKKVPITGDNRTDLLAIALSQLGYQEGNSNGSFSGESSGSSNYVEFSYNMGDLGLGYGGSDYPWCASFVSWCLYQSRCTDQGTYSALARDHNGDINYIWKEISCSQWVTQLNNFGYFKKSSYRGGTYKPQTGDLVFFTNGSGASHIGICLYTDSSKIYTVEGNTSDAAGLETNGGGVYFKNYSLSSSYLYGYGTMPYKEDASVPDIDYSGTNPTPGLYIAANSNKYVYSSETATSHSYLLPRFSIFEVTDVCSNGRLAATCTINGQTINGYILNNEDRVIQLSSAEDPTADERAALKTLIAKTESARHYQYSEAAIMELRTAYEKAVKSYNNTSAKESTLQERITTLEKALANTGTNEIALNNKGVYVNGINKKISTGDCVVFTNKHDGNGLISVSNANIAYTVNVVVKWNAELGMNVVKSVSVANGVDTASIQLESDEYLIAAHGWENISGSDVSVEYSGTNFSLLSNLKVGTGVIASGINLDDTTGVAPCSFVKFVPADAVRMNSRNEIVEAGDFTLFTPEFNSGKLTAANANIHKTLNVIAKWDVEKEGWYVADKYVGTGAEDATITIADGTVVIAGLVKEDDGISKVSYEKLNAAKVGDKIIFSGITPTEGNGISVAANVSFETVASEEEIPGEDTTTKPVEEDSTEETSTEKDTTTEKQTTTEKDTTEKTTTEKTTTEKTTTEKTTTEKTTTEKITTEKNTTEKETTTKKPVEDTSTKDTSTEESTTEKITTEKNTTEKETTTKKPVEDTSTEDTTTEKDTTEKQTEESSDQKTEEDETTEKVQDEEESSSKEDNSDEEESSSEEESSKEEESSDEEESTEADVDAQKPVIVQKPISAEYFCKDTAVALKTFAKTDDGGTLSYQWYRNKKKSTSGATKISGATDMAYVPTTDVAGSYYYYCIITNTNTKATGKKTAVINSGYAKIQVRKLANKITGVNSSWKKSVDAAVFKLPATAKGKITFKSSNENVATVSSTGSVAVKRIGTAYITITAGDALYQTVTKKVKIQVVPATVKMNYIASSAKKALSVKWEKMSGISGFKIQYSTTKDFKNLKTSYVGSLRHSKTRSDLVAGQKYYVRVCAYKKIGKTTYQGAYSNVKSYVVKSK